MKHFDVVILGAGPAGAATALALRKFQPHLSLALIESSDFQSRRPGEILSAAAIPVMQKLGIYDCFLEQQHQPTYSITHAWGNETIDLPPPKKPHQEDNWIVDRSRFDSMLAGLAAASGVSFFRASMSEAINHPDGSWQLHVQSPTTTRIINTSFVVDATGRGARFATAIGIPQIAHDTMVAIVRIINLDGQKIADGPLIEAFEHGWWYSVPLEDDRIAVVAMTDADINKRLQLTHILNWSEQLQHSPLTHQRIEKLNVKGELCVRAAHTRSLYKCSGKNWLAVGDAATSMDPLSSSGIVHAMRFGIHAGNAIEAHFNVPASNLEQYDQLVIGEFENHLNVRADQYRRESRWENSAFWERRRMAAPTSLFNPAHESKSTLSLSHSAIANHVEYQP